MYTAGKDIHGVPYAREVLDSVEESSNPVSCSDADVAYLSRIHILGWCAIIFGITELFVAVPIYQFLINVKLGAWWAVVMIVIGGAICAVGKVRGVIVAGCVCAAIGVITGVIGALTDFIAAAVFEGLDSCGQPQIAYENNPNELTLYGNPNAQWGVEQCFDSELGFHSVQTYNCYCTKITPVFGSNGDMSKSSGATASCGFYKLSQSSIDNDYDCDAILTWYGSHLSTSGLLLFGATAFCLALSITSCCALCCARPKEVNIFTTTHLQQALIAE